MDILKIQIEVVLLDFNLAATVHFRFKAIKGVITIKLFVFRVLFKFVAVEKD